MRSAISASPHLTTYRNAAMESFFSLLQKNMLDRQRWTTRDQLRLSPHRPTN
jgi:hypothetical protein